MLISARTKIGVACWLAGLACAGCGDSAAPRHDLSGRVTYLGEPVPVGRILFSPDLEQDPHGVATVADIQRGVYRTRPGKGALAGTYLVTIFGADETVATEEHDNSLFAPYRTQITVGPGRTVFDLVVPPEAKTP